MINIYNLVPKDKHDKSNIEKFKGIEPNEAEPILEDLMKWMQDINWPVAQELRKALPRFHKQLVPVIKRIFKTNEDDWKHWTLTLLRAFPKETLLEFKPELERIANFPTSSEKEWESDEIANEILDLI